MDESLKKLLDKVTPDRRGFVQRLVAMAGFAAPAVRTFVMGAAVAAVSPDALLFANATTFATTTPAATTTSSAPIHPPKITTAATTTSATTTPAATTTSATTTAATTTSATTTAGTTTTSATTRATTTPPASTTPFSVAIRPQIIRKPGELLPHPGPLVPGRKAK